MHAQSNRHCAGPFSFVMCLHVAQWTEDLAPATTVAIHNSRGTFSLPTWAQLSQLCHIVQAQHAQWGYQRAGREHAMHVAQKAGTATASSTHCLYVGCQSRHAMHLCMHMATGSFIDAVHMPSTRTACMYGSSMSGAQHAGLPTKHVTLQKDTHHSRKAMTVRYTTAPHHAVPWWVIMQMSLCMRLNV